MRLNLILTIFIILLFYIRPIQAQQQVSDRIVHTYALLVGSNLPGKNQEVLRFAHEDAERVGEVLREIGDFDEKNITLLIDPDGETLRNTLKKISEVVANYDTKDEQTRFLFYYSGHARAHGLTLGNDEVLLDELRHFFESLPATVKIVILDACQAGAFSRIKGAEHAVDFSHNSAEILNTSGMAVLASSTASELSQESGVLKGSYFTHHLVVGLRGAADRDQNGQVTLNEAYLYAYNQTLVATAGSAVGKQHVSLETKLKSKGEMVLTKPAEATARLFFPAELEAELLVTRAADQTILAEAHKSVGFEMGLAFPPDNYEVLVREKESVRRCSVTLSENQTAILNASGCKTLEADPVMAKHVVPQDEISRTPKEPFKWLPLLELIVGGLVIHEQDAFLKRLESEYDHDNNSSRTQLYYEFLIGLHFNRYLFLGAHYSSLDHIEYEKETTGWRSHRFGIKFRLSFPILRDHLIPFTLFGIGMTVSKTWAAASHQTSSPYKEIYWGPALSVGAGLIGMIFRSVGILCKLEYIYSPNISNMYGDFHNSGGLAITGGIRITL